jgi:hypothetical protein
MPSTNTSPSPNPYFKNTDRAPYELGCLLQQLPEDFSTIVPITPDVLLKVTAEADHARNANNTLMSGLEALGKTMFVAASHEQLDDLTVSDLGCLIQHLAVEAQFLQETQLHLNDVVLRHHSGDA